VTVIYTNFSKQESEIFRESEIRFVSWSEAEQKGIRESESGNQNPKFKSEETALRSPSACPLSRFVLSLSKDERDKGRLVEG
jgi:hypothetical protein